MAIKKTELYSSLWASCDELRGGMDASQYKDYVLTLLFMKYVSDKYKSNPYSMIVVPEGASFDDMLKLKGDKEIGDKINKIIALLAEENDLKGVIDVADFNDEDKLGKGKEMQDRLSKLIGIFEGLDLSSNRAEGDDLLGDAYEYLMRHFATESGKSKGQLTTLYYKGNNRDLIAWLSDVAVKKGKKLELTFTATEAGDYTIACAMGVPRGSIKVIK